MRMRTGWAVRICATRVHTLSGPAFGRTDFSRIFIFEPPDFFRGFSRRIFSPNFLVPTLCRADLG